MKLLGKKEISSVVLLEIEMSEDELDVYERALRYLTEKCELEEIEKILGGKKDEIENGIYQDILGIVSECTNISEKKEEVTTKIL